VIRQRVETLPYLSEALGAAQLLMLPRIYRRARLTGAEAHGILQDRLQHRDRDFLTLVKQTVYGHASSPYLDLLRTAGCEYGDVERLVQAEGLEAALGALFRRGVYLTLDELKGRRPAVRGSASIPVTQARLRNPRLGGYATLRRGGSHGPQTVVPLNVAPERELSVNRFLIAEARGEETWEQAVWNVPGGTGVAAPLRFMLLGQRLARWYTHVDYYDPSLHPRYRWSARVLHMGSLLAGEPIVPPRFVSVANPLRIARWMADALRRGRTPQLVTYSSPAVRLCQAAMEAGLDIAGAWFSLGGEPTTAARRALIESTGARIITSYSASEAGNLGRGCLAPNSPDDTHFFQDLHAVVQPGADGLACGLPPQALLLTSLRPGARFVLFNTCLGDQADLGPRSCGCPLEQLGWPTHVSSIRSFEKLTAGGMTFHDVDLIHTLEQVLPQRFGGGPTDYQLLDEEGPDGRPHVHLLVHPRLGPLDTDAIRSTFLDAISMGASGDRVMTLAWIGGDVLTVEREEPHATATGKIQHVHLVRAAGGSAARSDGEGD
jgi:hypothetical protein